MIRVLRLGHRVGRDPRITTHVCLVARAFGAGGIVLSGEKDDEVVRSAKKVVEKWGGRFSVCYRADWKKALKEQKRRGGKAVHLTMYGEPIQKRIGELRKARNLLLVVGAGKVPSEAYQMSDYNIAVTSQPHSEVAALAVCLHELFKGKELEKQFDGVLRISPRKRGKCVVSCEK